MKFFISQLTKYYYDYYYINNDDNSDDENESQYYSYDLKQHYISIYSIEY